MGATASVARRRNYRAPALVPRHEGVVAPRPRRAPQPADRLAVRRAEARSAVQTVLQAEGVECRRAWNRLRNELDACFDSWSTKKAGTEEAMQIKATLRAAIAMHDSAHLCTALHRAESLGMQSSLLRSILDDLLAREDLEGTWLCLSSALQEEDHFALGFWLDEARVKQLVVPPQVHALWDEVEFLSRSAASGFFAELPTDGIAGEPQQSWPYGVTSPTGRRARGGDLTADDGFFAREPSRSENGSKQACQYQEELDYKVRQAFAMQDLDAVRSLAVEATMCGLDASFAYGVALTLEENLYGEATPSKRTSAPYAFEASNGRPRPGASAATAAQDSNGQPDIVSELRSRSVRDLKADLNRLGIDTRGVLEKEELVQLVANRGGGTAVGAQSPGAASTPVGGFGQSAPRHQPGGGVPRQAPDSQSGGSRQAPDSQGGGSRQAAPGPQGPGPGAGGASGAGGAGAAAGTASQDPEPPPRRSKPRTSASFKQGASGGGAGKRTGSAPRPQPRPPPAQSSGPTRAGSLACLGITSLDPTEEELRKAYKRAAMRWHPDRQHNHDHPEEAKQKFVEVRTAYEYLLKAFPGSTA